MSRILCSVSLFVFVATASAQPVTYELDPVKTELLALTSPGGIPGASHPHVIVATKVTGKIVFDAAAPEASSVKLSFPTDGLRNDDPALRKREGMGEMSDGSREAVGNNMRGDDQLDPPKFPTISFESKGFKDLGHGQLEVRGTISIRGVGKDVSLPVNVSVKDDVFTGTGALLIKHSDFKFKAYSAALGAVKNLDEITLKVKLVGRAKAEAKPLDAGAAP